MAAGLGLAVAGGVGLADTVGSPTSLGVASRVSVFVPIGEYSDVEFGLTGMTGIHDPYHSLRFWYGNLDLKYKWKPDTYTSWTIQGEALINSRAVDDGAGSTRSIVSGGGFLSADLQFYKVLTVGIRGDWSEAPYAADDRVYGGTAWFGYYPVEESMALRFHVQHHVANSPSSGRMAFNTVALQILFSLGPHRAHPF